MEIVYVLRLEDECWYVGTTIDLARRIEQHERREGSRFTKQHRVIKLHHYIEVSTGFSPGEETRKTAELMYEHGVNKVRGALFIADYDYTLDDLNRWLIIAIGHSLKKDFGEVGKKLKRELPPTPPLIQLLRHLASMRGTVLWVGLLTPQRVDDFLLIEATRRMTLRMPAHTKQALME